MTSLTQTGSYTVPAGLLEAIRADFAAGWADDETAAKEIAARWTDSGYLCDPHTAVAFRVAEEYGRETGRPCVVLSTANPYKFPAAVLQALGQPVPRGDFDALRALSACTGTTPPAQLAGLEGMTERFDRVIDPAEISTVALEK